MRTFLTLILVTTASCSTSTAGSPFPSAFAGASRLKPASCFDLMRSRLEPLRKRAKASRTETYVAESGSNEVDEFSNVYSRHGGKFVSSVTSGISTPEGIAIDSYGTLYVANVGNNTVTEYANRTGTPTLTISQGVDEPIGVAVDSYGTVYVSNISGSTWIDEYPAGSTTPSATITGFEEPLQMTFDASGDLYVVDGGAGGNGDVYEVAVGQTKPAKLGLEDLGNPDGIALDSHGDILVADTFSNPLAGSIKVYLPGQKLPVCVAGLSKDRQSFGNPEELALGRSGALYVPVQVPSALLAISPHGYVLRSATSDSHINNPVGVALWEEAK